MSKSDIILALETLVKKIQPSKCSRSDISQNKLLSSIGDSALNRRCWQVQFMDFL